MVLAPPWPAVHAALSSAKNQTTIAKGFLVLFLGASYAAAVFRPQPRPGGEDEWVVVFWVAAALLVPALVHIIDQFGCTRAPRTHGGGMAAASLGILPFVFLALGGLLDFHPTAVFFVIAGAEAVMISFGLWLVFLKRLGASLGDRALRASVRSFIPWFWLGGVCILLLLAGPYCVAPTRRDELRWCCWPGAGTVTFVLLHQYGAVLGTAVRAVGRWAPVVPRR
jgi:hypothetical protein